MAPSKGVKVDWDGIDSINQQLGELADKVDAAARHAHDDKISAQHFSTVDHAPEAGQSSVAASQAIGEGVRQAQQVLTSIVAAVKSSVDQNRRDDDESKRTFAQQNKDVN